uniref:Sentrin-specific protease 8 n=1 Tax=Aegilops tauschii TaxID=37682 RepID=N1QQ56_AEGTA
MADPKTLKYRLRPVEFKGKQTHIICYHNVPVWPTTVAVVNYFLLTDPSCFKFDKTVDFISVYDLRNMAASLGDKAVTHIKQDQTKDWTKDERKDKYNKLRGKISQNPTLVLKGMEIASEFLQNSQTELTQQGIKLLMSNNDAIAEGNLCALYRKHLNLMYKHKGNLYVLVTEGDTQDIPPTAIWKSLTMGFEEQVLFTDNFVPLPADEQPNKAGREWVVDWQKRLADSEAKKQDKKMRRKSHDDKLEGPPNPVIVAYAPAAPLDSLNGQTTSLADASKVPVLSSADKKLERPTSPGRVAYAPASSDSLNGQTASVPDASEVPVLLPTSVIWKLAFSDFLEKYIYGESDVYYFPTLLNFMKSVTLFKFEVRISDIAIHNLVLALAIQGNIESFTELLTQPVIDFMIKQEFDAEEVIKKRVELIFHDDMPAQRRVISFSDYAKYMVLVWSYQTYNGTWENATSLDGRQAGLGYLAYILRNHALRKSWGGNFVDSDMKVIDGQFIIDKPAVEEFNQNNICVDLTTLIKNLQRHYRSKVAGPPAYFDVFQQDIMQLMPHHQKNPEEYEEFLVFLQNHFAFKAPLVCSTLLRELFVVVQSLRRYLNEGKLGPALPRLSARSNQRKWARHAQQGVPFSGVYHYADTLKKTQQNPKRKENPHGSTTKENTEGSTAQENTEGSMAQEKPQGRTPEKPQGSIPKQKPQGSSTKQTPEKPQGSIPKQKPQGSSTKQTPEKPQGSIPKQKPQGSSTKQTPEKPQGSIPKQKPQGSSTKQTPEKPQGSIPKQKPQGSSTKQTPEKPQGSSTKQKHKGKILDRFMDETYWKCLQYGRYFIEHAFDHTKKDGQKVKNLIIIQLMLDGRLGPAISELIWYMMRFTCDGPFSPVWTHFKKSEYDDRPRSAQDEETKSISNLDDDALADRAASASEDKVLLKHQGVSLYRADVDSLNEPAFITDAIIRFCVALYCSTLNCKDVRFLGASLSTAICIYPDFGEQYDLGSLPLVLLVSNNLHPERGYGGNHWSLLILDSVTDPLCPRLVHHDSSGNANRSHAERYAKAIRELLADKFGDAILCEGPTPKQTNEYDCGVYVAAVAKSVLDWYNRPQRQQGTDWFRDIQEQVSAESVSRLRVKIRDIIRQLIQENENKSGMSGKETEIMSNLDDSAKDVNENKAGGSGKETEIMSNLDDSVLADRAASAPADAKDVNENKAGGSGKETDIMSNLDDSVLADRAASAPADAKDVNENKSGERTDVDSLIGREFVTDAIIQFCVVHYSSILNCKDIRFLDASAAIGISIRPSFGAEYDLDSFPLLLLPVSDSDDPDKGDGGNHWSLLVVDGASNPFCPRFVHHDSSGNANRSHAERYANGIRQLLPGRFGAAILYEGPTPQQNNGCDCGLYVAAVAKAILDWYTRPRQQRGTDWFTDVQAQVSVQSVSRLRADLRDLIKQLIQENKAGESGDE